VALLRHDPAAALAHGDHALAHAEPHQARKLMARAQELRARALLVQDRRADAVQAAEAALATAHGIGHAPSQWRAHAILAAVARRDGRTAEAAGHTAAADALLDARRPYLPADLHRALRGRVLGGDGA